MRASMTFPVSVPATLCTYAAATRAAGIPADPSCPIACSVSRTHGGLTNIDTDAARHFERRGASKSLQPGIHEADGRAALHRFAGQHSARQRERSVIADVGEPDAHEIDLSHQLTRQAEREIVVGQRLQRPNFRWPQTGSAARSLELSRHRQSNQVKSCSLRALRLSALIVVVHTMKLSPSPAASVAANSRRASASIPFNASSVRPGL